MIASSTYEIQHPQLKPFIQYILFNKADLKGSTATSFGNNNICLGILKDSALVQLADGSFTNEQRTGIHSYLSGLYLKPHRFVSNAPLDEICIDFTMRGYHSFFRFPLSDYILDDVLYEAFGKDSREFFHKVFAIADISLRGKMIEQFLYRHILDVDLRRVSKLCHQLDTLALERIDHLPKQLGYSERSLQRHFNHYFGITPKKYTRMIRFRKALKYVTLENQIGKCSDVAYQLGFFDESHLNKEFKYFTCSTPRRLASTIKSIDDRVLVSA